MKQHLWVTKSFGVAQQVPVQAMMLLQIFVELNWSRKNCIFIHRILSLWKLPLLGFARIFQSWVIRLELQDLHVPTSSSHSHVGCLEKQTYSYLWQGHVLETTQKPSRSPIYDKVVLIEWTFPRQATYLKQCKNPWDYTTEERKEVGHDNFTKEPICSTVNGVHLAKIRHLATTKDMWDNLRSVSLGS